ncbi:nitrate- and nitrite sensing domain-containing protein [Actinomadura sp. 9N407]|uniref:sensor histidine kinase n=1 Tax=Actinomadura sp. 9N407 TaxID=3375154 RepID=UPI0037BA84A4
MRSRRRSIRFTLFGLLTIPLAALLGLWGFAANASVRDALDKRNLDTINRTYSTASLPLLTHLAQERAQTQVWLSARGRVPRTALDAQRQKTDTAVTGLKKAAGSSDFQGTLDGTQKRLMADLLKKVDAIVAARQGIDSGGTGKLAAFEAYNAAVDANFQFSTPLLKVDDTDVFQLANDILGMIRAQELAGREATLVGGAMAAGGRMSHDEQAAFTRLVHEQRFLLNESVGRFDPQFAEPFRAMLASPVYQDFKAQEDRIMASRGSRTGIRIDGAAWQPASQAYLASFQRSIGQIRTALDGDMKVLSNAIFMRLALVGGLGLLAVLLSGFLMLRFGRRISRELIGLQDAARDLADQRLPDVVRRLRLGEDVDVLAEAPPLAGGKTAEVTSVAAAFSTVQRTAIEAAVGQAELRKAVNQVFRNLARRNQSLLHRQLAMLDTLERKASDPDALEDLFKIDHLTTRMRRHAEGLIILSGAHPGRGWRKPVAVLDVLRGAVGEIEDYSRVEVVSTAREAIVGTTVADLIHLLAELIENAVAFSPPSTPVEVDAGAVGNGFVIEIQDRGLGMSPDKLAAINEQLTRPPEFNLSEGDQLGLFVVGSLAHRHGVRISLEPNAYGGLKTIVLLPHGIVVSPEEAARAGDAPDQTLADESATATNGTGEPSMRHPRSDTGRHRVAQAEIVGAAPPVPDPFPAPAPVPAPVPAPASYAHPEHASFAPPEPAAAPVPPQGGTHAGMPRRVRRANLAPQLRKTAETRSAERSATTTGEIPRPPERARSFMSSMQSGWQRGRAEDIGTGTPDEGTDADQGEQ